MKSILVKDNVKFKEMTPQILKLFLVLSNIWSVEDRPPVVTSANDGRHKTGSLHYANNAVDLRTKHLNEQEKKMFVERLTKELGKDWDIILEHMNGPEEHLHVEYDPK